MRARLLVPAAAGGVAVVVVAAWATLGSGGANAAAADADGARRSTVAVERRDLVERESLDGTLGYADARPLAAARPGTLTWLPDEGTVVGRGGVLMRVNGQPVFLLRGETPAWRSLSRGSSDGEDVRQLERNLVALGYDPNGDIDVDGDFDWATENAVKRWQDARGVAEDGVVDQSEIVFLPGDRRIGQHEATLGSSLQSGSPVAETTSTRQVVTVHLEAIRQGLVSRGESVRVELPGGATVAGRVTEIGKVVETEELPDGSEGDPYIEFEVVLTGARTALDQAPVDVHVESDRSKDVLAVPVSALVALAGGGYALETADGRLLAVELGAFADGYVEVSGNGLRAGERVVVPA